MTGDMAEPLGFACSAIYSLENFGLSPCRAQAPLAMGGFLFENAATRASLKSAFDHLFCKYGREFDDDDEIDLLDLSIVKVGGHVLAEKVHGFGSCYKKPGRHEQVPIEQNNSSQEVSENKDDHQEDNYDDVFVRLSGKVKAAQMRTLHEPLTFSPLPPLKHHWEQSLKSPPRKLIKLIHKSPVGTKNKPAAQVTSKLKKLALDDGAESEDEVTQPKKLTTLLTFDEHLWTMVKMEEKSLLARICQCKSRRCFDCQLIKICI